MHSTLINMKNIKKILLASLLLGLFFSGSSVHAVSTRNNNVGIPNSVQAEMASYSGGSCNGFNHAQFVWLSPSSDPKSQSITIQQGVPSVNLKFNMLSAHCDSNTNLSTGNVKDTTLKLTRTQITSAGLKTGSVGTLSSPPSGDIELNYNQSYAISSPNFKYIKRDAFNNADPNKDNAEFKQFTVSGLSGLAPRDAAYTINIEIEARLVHRYMRADGSPYYKCVANINLNPIDINGVLPPSDNVPDNRCPTIKKEAKLSLYVNPQFAGGCKITEINGISTDSDEQVYLNPGSTFKAKFIVGNSGTSNWPLADTDSNPVRLGTPLNDPKWGSAAPFPHRVTITGNASSGRVLNSGAFSPIFERSFTVSPSISTGPQSFKWEVLRESVRSIDINDGCKADIFIRKNLPYMHVKGGDVISGAQFATGDSCAANPTNAALNANIYTNGFGAKNNLNLTSGSQYAVFASGEIGSASTALDNAFNGNYNYFRGTVKDALFANNSPSEDDYGKFYTGATLPCSKEAAESTASATPISGTPASFLTTAGTEVRYVDGNVSLAAGTLTIPAGTKKTLIVKGTLTIAGNIQYADSAPSAISLVKIIADNIHVQQGVNRIDANVTAYARTASDGILDTCSTVAPAGGWSSSAFLGTNTCATRLVFNGSVAARRILWKRTYGTVGVKPGPADETCILPVYGSGAGEIPIPADISEVEKSKALTGAAQRAGTCAAEFVNFSPASYLGNFSEPGTSVGSVPKSTLELPPIY